MLAKKILIVGGGNAGLSVASQLLRKNKSLQINIIDPSEKHYYQPAWTLVGAGVFDINKTVRNEKEVKAITEDDVELITIPHIKLNEWLCKYTTWKNYIMHSFNERFLELLKSIESIAFHKLDERLVAYLKEKQKLSGSSVIKASHYLIADELATSRVGVSRLLKQLENDGKILLYRNEIKLLKGFN